MPAPEALDELVSEPARLSMCSYLKISEVKLKTEEVVRFCLSRGDTMKCWKIQMNDRMKMRKRIYLMR